MEAIGQREDGIVIVTTMSGAILSCDLDSAFVGLGTGIGEIYLLHTGSFTKKLGKRGRGLVIVKV